MAATGANVESTPTRTISGWDRILARCHSVCQALAPSAVEGLLSAFKSEARTTNLQIETRNYHQKGINFQNLCRASHPQVPLPTLTS
jgi:hypothetical protein